LLQSSYRTNYTLQQRTTSDQIMTKSWRSG